MTHIDESSLDVGRLPHCAVVQRLQVLAVLLQTDLQLVAALNFGALGLDLETSLAWLESQVGLHVRVANQDVQVAFRLVTVLHLCFELISKSIALLRMHRAFVRTLSQAVAHHFPRSLQGASLRGCLPYGLVLGTAVV